jgi:phage tail sheath protein FI
MATDSRFHGVDVRRDNQVARPVEIVDISPVFMAFTAPDADPAVWPLDQNVIVLEGDVDKISALGERGTGPVAFTQLYSQGIIPQVVGVRVERAPKPDSTFLDAVTNDIIKVSGEVVDRDPNEEFDVLAQSNVILISRVWQGDDEFVRDTDWTREDNKIVWLSTEAVETVRRLTGGADQLEYRDKVLLSLSEVSQGTTQFAIATEGQSDGDCALLENVGVEWFDEKIDSITADVGNTGDGTVTSTLNIPVVGNYVLVVTDDTIAGSEIWSLTDPNGISIGPVTTGVAFTHAQLNVTITAGTTAFVNGDTVTITTVATNKPNPHTEYLATYKYANARPADSSNYQVDYEHYEFASVIDEIVNRSDTSDYDWLENRDIITVSDVSQTTITFTEGTDWEMVDDQIHWIQHNEQEAVTKSAIFVDSTSYGGGNIGNGTIGSINLNAALVGNYQLIVTDATVAGSEIWTLTAPDASILSLTVTTGVAYSDTQIDFTIAAGGVNWNVGDTIQITVDGGTDSLVNSAYVKDITEITQGVNTYVELVDWEEVNGEIHWISDNRPADASSYDVSYTWANEPQPDSNYTVSYSYETGEYPAISNIIGEIDQDGNYTGLQNALICFTETGLRPGIIIAPGFSHYPQVLAAMDTLATAVEAVTIACTPRSGTQAGTRESAVAYRKEWGSNRIYLHARWDKFWNQRLDAYDVAPPDARIAAQIVANDNNNGIYWSPSNQLAVGYLGTDVPVSDAEAEFFNDNDLCCTKRSELGGYVLWGNRTTSRDAALPFLCQTRMDILVILSIQRALRIYVDNPIGTVLFDNLGETVTQLLRGLAATGQIFIGDNPFYIDPAKNTIANLQQGRIVCDFDVYFVPPAEHIIITRHLDSSLLTQAFENSQFVKRV